MAYELGTWIEDVLESRASWQRHPRGHARVHERARQIAAPWDARASAEPRPPLWPLDHLLLQRLPADLTHANVEGLRGIPRVGADAPDRANAVPLASRAPRQNRK